MAMKEIFLTVSILGFLTFNACGGTQALETNQTGNVSASGAKAENAADKNSSETETEKTASTNAETVQTQNRQPRTVRDFFNLLPQKYFPLEGCEPAKDKNCERARREYVKSFLEVEDTANGYWKSSCDGGQSCLRMALFKRPDGTYIVGVHTLFETDETNHFLEYKNGKWLDISAKVIPEFSSKNIYELPRYGTTVEVFKKNYPEPEYSERGAKAYELEWKDGKFSIKR